MKFKAAIFVTIVFLLSGLSGCGQAPNGIEIPPIDPKEFNVAMVLIGPHNDQGWSQSHYDGLVFVENMVKGIHTAYLQNVPPDDSSEAVFRGLAEAGYDLIFGTTFEYMGPMERAAADYPEVTFIHLTGSKSNGANFGNLMGAMENMKYLAGMVAGARAQKDGNPRLGYIATFPIAEELRLGNAIALGMAETCPDCTMDVEWIYTWHDPKLEEKAARALFERGAQVVLTGADTPVISNVAEELNRWSVTYDWSGSCSSPRCLTAPYWNWGPVYARITRGVMDGTYRPGWDYFEVSSGGLGLYGFMPGQQLKTGAAELSLETLTLVRSTLANMTLGDFTRFDVFAGPIIDNQGRVIIPAGSKMEQLDLEQFPEDNLGCTYCMKWWAQGVVAEIPEE